MNKINPKAEKGSENRGTGWFRYRQSKSSNFIYKKENPVGRCEDIKNDIFDLVLQGQTKFQNNWNDVQYAVNNLLKTTLSAPTYPELGVGETALTIVQNIILDNKIKKNWQRGNAGREYENGVHNYSRKVHWESCRQAGSG